MRTKDIEEITKNEKSIRACFLESLYQDRWKEDRRNWKVASKLTVQDRKRFEELINRTPKQN
jgi:hypothetical protein